jgi:hypothetical protein
MQIVPAAAQSQRNLILFVPDGLRPNSVTPETAPTLAAVRDKGVNFVNPHSLFPTFTMANASGMATGHFLGDTGAYSNTIYTAYPVPTAGGSVTPFIENDPILGDIDAHFFRQLRRRGHNPFCSPAPGFEHRGDRQARPDFDLRSYRAHR